MEVPRVKYISPHGDHTGYGEASRNIIYALYKAGVDLVTERVTFVREAANFGELQSVAENLEARQVNYNIKIIHLTPDQYIHHIEQGKFHIGHLFWETDRIPKIWAWNCNRMDEIWTGAEITKQAFINSGVRVPIYIFPQPIVSLVEKIDPFIIPNKSGFVFYTIFEWTERKNPRALLEAYWREFYGEDKVTLLIKAFRENYSQSKKNGITSIIREWKEKTGQGKLPKVLFCGDLLSQRDMYRLHETGDCFVSAHRGEGWGRPQAEAMLMGKPIISTNYGGVHELLDDKSAYLVSWNGVPVTPEEGRIFYTPDQNWAEVDQADLRRKMRQVFDNPSKAKEVGLVGQKIARERLSPEVVGEQMLKRLIEISAIAYE